MLRRIFINSWLSPARGPVRRARRPFHPFGFLIYHRLDGFVRAGHANKSAPVWASSTKEALSCSSNKPRAIARSRPALYSACAAGLEQEWPASIEPLDFWIRRNGFGALKQDGVSEWPLLHGCSPGGCLPLDMKPTSSSSSPSSLALGCLCRCS
jgi:hypothetical protein